MEWIKFRDKWPEVDEPFLFFSRNFCDGDYIIFIAYLNPESKFTYEIRDDHNRYHSLEVNEDSWMPLPDKPKE